MPTAKKVSAKKVAAKKTPAKKTLAKKAAVKKPAAKKRVGVALVASGPYRGFGSNLRAVEDVSRTEPLL
jgi:hypothetical protein